MPTPAKATPTPAKAARIAQQMDATFASLRQIDPHPAYEMTYTLDYRLDAILAQGSQSDAQVFQQVFDLYGFQPVSRPVGLEGKGCSGFTAAGANGDYYFAHNEDWRPTKHLVLHTAPPKGYTAVSIGVVEHIEQRERGEFLVTPYLPLVGMNDQGLAVSTYTVPACTPPQQPGKTYLYWLPAIRLLLDRAADLAQALELLDRYNLVIADADRLQMLIGDAQGRSAIVAWVDGQTAIVEKSGVWQAVTNFLQKDAPAAAFDADVRYCKERAALATHASRMTHALGMEILSQVAQNTEKFSTQFSVVCNLTRRTLELTFDRKFDQIHRFSLAG